MQVLKNIHVSCISNSIHKTRQGSLQETRAATFISNMQGHTNMPNIVHEVPADRLEMPVHAISLTAVPVQ